MTDAREIIARLLRREFGPHADRVAVRDFFQNIEAAGIRFAGPDDRILGLDDLDDVTLERAAKVAETGYWSSALGTAVGSAVAAAIRSLKGGRS